MGVELRRTAWVESFERVEVDAHRAGLARDVLAVRAHAVAERHRGSVGDATRKPKSSTAVAPGLAEPSVNPGGTPIPRARKRRARRMARWPGLASQARIRLSGVSSGCWAQAIASPSSQSCRPSM